MDGGNLLFPISYIFGDVLVEVYGYAQSRRIIWLGFVLNIFAAGAFSLVAILPPAPGWEMQEAFASILLQTPRVVLGSVVAFWCGSFLNAWVMAKMKVWTSGRHLWMRTIGSTIAGEGVDSLLFTALAFGGVWPLGLVGQVIFWNFVLKTGYEILATPLTYFIVQRLKRAERVLQQTGYLPAGWVTVPGQGARLDASGNMSSGQLMQILSQLRAQTTAGYTRNMAHGKRGIKAQERAGGRFFVIPPGGKTQPGVYQREFMGRGITPVLIFVRAATYSPRLGMERIAQKAGLEQYVQKRIRYHIYDAAKKAE